MSLRLDEELEERIESMRKKIKPKPSKNWTVRHLLELGLEKFEKSNRKRIPKS